MPTTTFFSASSSGAATQRAAPRRRQMTSLVRRQPCALLAGQVDLSRLAFGGSGGLPRPGGPGPSPAAGGTPASGTLTLKPRPVPPGTFIPSKSIHALAKTQWPSFSCMLPVDSHKARRRGRTASSTLPSAACSRSRCAFPAPRRIQTTRRAAASLLQDQKWATTALDSQACARRGAARTKGHLRPLTFGTLICGAS